jgi:site-specific recombinase XerD
MQIVRSKATDNLILIQDVTNKDTLSRLSRYVSFLDQHQKAWWKDIDLRAYRDHLRSERLADSSIGAHLITIRSAYRKLARNRELFYRILNDMVGYEQASQIKPADAKALADEMIAKLVNAIHPDEAKLTQLTIQDRTDRQQTRLTVEEVTCLIGEPERVFGVGNPTALRDAALLALLATTGLREAELVDLNIGDLYQTSGGEPCLLVREGKGRKQRVIPYGDLTLGLSYTERWLQVAGSQVDIKDDTPVFWSFWKDGKTLRDRLSLRRVGEIVRRYWVERDGQPLSVAPHDLRRTYARIQFEAGLDILAISQNMGHTSIEMTRRYIGQMGMAARRNRNVF